MPQRTRTGFVARHATRNLFFFVCALCTLANILHYMLHTQKHAYEWCVCVLYKSERSCVGLIMVHQVCATVMCARGFLCAMFSECAAGYGDARVRSCKRPARVCWHGGCVAWHLAGQGRQRERNTAASAAALRQVPRSHAHGAHSREHTHTHTLPWPSDIQLGRSDGVAVADDVRRVISRGPPTLCLCQCADSSKRSSATHTHLGKCRKGGHARARILQQQSRTHTTRTHASLATSVCAKTTRAR